jgi:hypothetical protein
VTIAGQELFCTLSGIFASAGNRGRPAVDVPEAFLASAASRARLGFFTGMLNYVVVFFA